MEAGKTRVVVLYGGRSTEHEVSCRSAAFILRNLNRARYDVQAVAIDKDGRWLPQNVPSLMECLEAQKGPVPIDGMQKAGAPLPTRPDPASNLLAWAQSSSPGEPAATVFFPVIHGTFGEDGSLQGLFDLAEAAYVGPDTLGSAIGMDKIVSKKLVQTAGVPVVPWVEAKAQVWKRDAAAICLQAVQQLGFPMFVKPARLGSSVGVSKVRTQDELRKACESAFKFDDKLLIEKGLDVREIEIAMLGDYEPAASLPGEVISHAEFYSYDAKYIDDGGASVAIPAKLEKDQVPFVQEMAKKVFKVLELYGMARVDLFLEKQTGRFYFNEVNTIPGFTEISLYPQLWKASGLETEQLVDRLVELALQRQQERRTLMRTK